MVRVIVSGCVALVSRHFGLSDSPNVILYKFNIYGKDIKCHFPKTLHSNPIDYKPNHLQDTSAKPTYQTASLKLLLRSKANNETIESTSDGPGIKAVGSH